MFLKDALIGGSLVLTGNALLRFIVVQNNSSIHSAFSFSKLRSTRRFLLDLKSHSKFCAPSNVLRLHCLRVFIFSENQNFLSIQNLLQHHCQSVWLSFCYGKYVFDWVFIISGVFFKMEFSIHFYCNSQSQSIVSLPLFLNEKQTKNFKKIILEKSSKWWKWVLFVLLFFLRTGPDLIKETKKQ